MPKPQPGKNYTVVKGDTIRNLSRSCYGSDQSQLVIQANWSVVKDCPISDEGLPIIYAGTVLFFPDTLNRYGKRKITADFDNEITIEIEGEKFSGFKASRIIRAINNISDGFTLETAFDYKNDRLVDALRPYKYRTTVLYVGGEPYIVGRQVKWHLPESVEEQTVTVEVRTKPGDMIECMNPAVTTEYKGHLLDIGKKIASVYGLKAYTANGTGSVFPGRVNKEPAETDFAFLARIAAQQGFLVTSSVPSYDTDGSISTADVGIMFIRAAVDEAPIAALRAGEMPVKSIGADYDGTKRFSSWTATTDDEDEPSVSKTLKDPEVPILRPFVFQAPDVDEKMIEQSAKWRMAKSIADATAITVTVAGWRNADGMLWSENRIVTLYAPAKYIFEETRFLIQAVELRKDPDGGDEAVLSLVLPEAYTLGMPTKFPWSKSYDKNKGPV